MENLQIVHEQELLGKTLKVYGSKEEPKFLAKDVAEWVDYSNSNIGKMLSSVDEEEKILIRTNCTNQVGQHGGSRKPQWFLTEDGFYEVLMNSKKPIAKQFKKQVKQILKSIRNHGAYMTADTIEKTLTDPDFLIGLATKLKEEQQKSTLLEEDNRKAQEVIEELTPLAEVFKRFFETESSLTTTHVCVALKEAGYTAKDYPQVRGANTMNAFLNMEDVQYKQGRASYWTLTQRYSYLTEEGYTVVRNQEKNGNFRPQLRWTIKGIEFITELLVRHKEDVNKWLA